MRKSEPFLFFFFLFFLSFTAFRSIGKEASSEPELLRLTTFHQEEEIPVQLLRFRENEEELSFIDNPSQEQSVAQLNEAENYLAVINGGYFSPEWKPLGLLMIDHHIIHPHQQNSLLSGIIAITPTSLAIIRSEKPLPPKTISALQAGPFFIDQGKITPTLETKKLAVRSWIATDGANNWAIGTISSPVSLAQAAQILSNLSEKIFQEHGIKTALNLDGGSSTSFLVNLPTERLQEGGHHIVRDIIGVKKRLKITSR